MIKLLIGPYRTGKTGLLLKELLEYKLSNPLDACLVLVPSHRYGRLLRQQLLEQAKVYGGQGVFAFSIATMYETCERILTQAGAAPNVLPAELCVRVISDVLRSAHADGALVHLDPIHDFPGTASSLFRMVDEFERAAITPSEAMKAVTATASTESVHYELAALYKRYWAKLDELGALDQKRMVLECRDLLAKKSVPGLNFRFVVADGFDRISPLQAEIIQGLTRHAAEMRITFDYVTPERRVQTAQRDDEYSWKDASYNELKKRLTLTETLIELPGPPTKPQSFVFTTLDLFAECQEVARRCKQAMIERGVPADQILVVARDISEYACAIKMCFKQAGLPVYVDEATEVLSVPWMKVLFQTLGLAANDFRRREVLDVLRSRYIDTGRFGWTLSDVDRLERQSFEKELISGLSQWRLAVASADLLAQLEQFFKDVTPPPSADRSAYCRWLEDLLENVFAVFSARAAVSKKNGARAAIAPTEADMQALGALRAALKVMIQEDALFGVQPLSFSAFVSHLRNLLDGANFRTGRPGGPAIYVSSAEQAPNRRFDEVFVLGALEGRFPKHSSETGFVSADERSRWRMFGLILHNPREEPGYEMALFTSLTDRARKVFHASFPQVDLSGDEVFSSFYLTDGTLSRRCSQPDGALPAERVDVSARALAQPLSPSEAAFGWLWRKHAFNIADAWADVAPVQEYWHSMSATVYGAYQRHSSGGGAEYCGDLSALIDANLLESKSPPIWSVSALNTYGECPFKYWVARSFRFKPVAEPEEGLDIKQKGLLYHKVLELYYGKLMERGLSAIERVHVGVAEEALQEGFKEVEDRLFFRPGPYWTNKKNEIAFRVKNFLEFDLQRAQKSGRVPQFLEVSFGKHDSKYPALRCRTDAGEVLIRGIIDRVDVARSGDALHATVIDYKSGTTAITSADARAGANLQLPVYALAVEQAIVPGSTVDEGVYLSVQGAKSIGSLAFREGNDSDLLDSVVARIAITVNGVMRSQFPVQPYTAKVCKNCDHKSICRIGDLQQGKDTEDYA